MAIGDYSKTTYANGVAPAINATNLNNNEDKTKELDIAVSSIETWQENEKPVSTSSRILDLTGDRAPAIPDDPAGVTLYKNLNFTDTSGWTGGTNVTLSVETSMLKVVGATAGINNVTLTSTAYQNKLIRLIIKTSEPISNITTVTGSVVFTPMSFRSIGSNRYMAEIYWSRSGSDAFNIWPNYGIGTAFTWYLEAIYIGTGAYLSKLIDRAGVPWTNHGALPVDGPFGKGLQFNGAQYLQAPGPMIGTTGTIAFGISPSTFSVNQCPLGNRSANGGFGTFIAATTGAMGINFRKTNGTIYDIPIGKISLSTTLWVTVIYTSTEIKVYKNGTLYSTTAVTDPIGISVNSFQVGKQADISTANAFSGTIYALRADSRVWTDEEIARWSRDPYSEDSGLVDAFSLNFSNLPTFADNAAAIAGNLPAGKLYKTSTGNVLVRY